MSGSVVQEQRLDKILDNIAIQIPESLWQACLGKIQGIDRPSFQFPFRFSKIDKYGDRRKTEQQQGHHADERISKPTADTLDLLSLPLRDYVLYRIVVGAHLLSQPDVAEVLVDVVAWADLPSAHDGAVRDDPVPPTAGDELMRLIVQGAFLEFTHDPSLLCRVAGAVHGIE